MKHSADKPAVLALNCAWPASMGGIPAFNRQMLATFAAAGHRTACLVEAPTRDDVEDAAAHGVELYAAERTPAGPSLVLDSPAARLLKPGIVIGHGRFTGPSAWVHKRRYHPDASLVHIVHTAPAEIERFKVARRRPSALRSGNGSLGSSQPTRTLSPRSVPASSGTPRTYSKMVPDASAWFGWTPGLGRCIWACAGRRRRSRCSCWDAPATWN